MQGNNYGLLVKKIKKFPQNHLFTNYKHQLICSSSCQVFEWTELPFTLQHDREFVMFRFYLPFFIKLFMVLLCVLFKSDRYLHAAFWVALSSPSSETQGQSVGSEEKAGRKFSSTGERAPGYQLSPNYFQKFKQMPAPDWAQKMLCIIVPNRRTASPEFFSWVRTRRLLTRSRLVCYTKTTDAFPKIQAWAYNRYSRLHRSRVLRKY